MSTVEEAVNRDLERIAKLDPELAKSALALSAVAMARELDHDGNSATSKSMCAGQLRETLAALRELTPKMAQKDGVDELSAKRAKRRAAQAK